MAQALNTTGGTTVNVADVPATTDNDTFTPSTDTKPFAIGTAYKPCDLITFDDGLAPITKKSEIKRLVRGDDGNIAKDEKGAVVIDGGWPDKFNSAEELFDAVEELTMLGEFRLSTSWDTSTPINAMENEIIWDFKSPPSDSKLPGTIYATAIPSVDDIVADESLVRVVIPQGVRANITRLHSTIGRIMANPTQREKYASILATLDMSPANILRVYTRLTESTAGIKVRQAMAVALWRGVVATFAKRLEDANVSGPQAATYAALIAELSMYAENPENMLRVVSSHDGVRKTLDNGHTPAKVIAAFEQSVAANLKALATSATPDEDGKVIFAAPARAGSKPKLISQRIVRKMWDDRAQTSYAASALNISDDDALMGIFAEVASEGASLPSQERAEPANAAGDTPAIGSAGDAPGSTEGNAANASA